MIQESVVTSFIPLMTSSSSTQGRKGVDDPTATSSGATATSTAAKATALADSSGSGKDNKDKNDDSKKKKADGTGGLDSTSERLLISAGSIGKPDKPIMSRRKRLLIPTRTGAFILFCFILWIVWRTMKKSKKNGGDSVVTRHRRPRAYLDQVLGKIPFLKRRKGPWQNLDGSSTPDVTAIPPSYEKAAATAGKTTLVYFTTGKQHDPEQSVTGVVGPSINGSVAYPGAAQFDSVDGASGTLASSDQSSTLRSRMPDAYYNQSELARQPSDAYNPAQRQANRLSALSSLSSGFGDGDIVVPQGLMHPPKAVQSSVRQSTSLVGRFSFTSKKSGSQRDTVYTEFTETSEDSPPKFRTISSWVNQQTGRIKRAEKRAEDTVPPVPGILGTGYGQMPPEPQLNMMADDGEVPRRPDTITTNAASP